jgi:integrase/recombinase XerD
MSSWALVTGATVGIGESFTRLLASNHYNIVLVARDLEKLNERAQSLEATYGVKTHVRQADLATDWGCGVVEKYIANISLLNPEQKLFYSQKRRSNGFNANTLTQHFHFLYKKSGVDGASSHSGRRTFITNLASKGVSVRVLMSLAGHKHLGTTQRYIDVNDNLLRSAVELV